MQKSNRRVATETIIAAEHDGLVPVILDDRDTSALSRALGFQANEVWKAIEAGQETVAAFESGEADPGGLFPSKEAAVRTLTGILSSNKETYRTLVRLQEMFECAPVVVMVDPEAFDKTAEDLKEV